MSNPGNQRAVTRAEYDKLTPAQQGFVTYMQGAWNPEVPNYNPYRIGSKERRDFADGEHRAVLLVQDEDDS